MSHLARAGALLVLFVGGFLFLRTVSTSMSIEFIGLSKTDNPRLWATRLVEHEPSNACTSCHKETSDSWQASAHVTVSCEDCHGLAKTHIAQAQAGQPAPLTLANARDLCLTCHAGLTSRPSGFPQVDPAQHVSQVGGSAGASCTSCHNPHSPGIPPEIPHTLEGRAACLACHGADKWKPVPADHADKTEDMCLRCHTVAAKAAP